MKTLQHLELKGVRGGKAIAPLSKGESELLLVRNMNLNKLTNLRHDMRIKFITLF